MTRKNAERKRASKPSSRRAAEPVPDPIRTTISAGGKSTTVTIDRSTGEIVDDEELDDVLAPVVDSVLQSSRPQEPNAPTTPAEHLDVIRKRYSAVHQWRLALDTRKEERKEAASQVEVAELVLEELCRARQQGEEIPGLTDDSPAAMQRAIRAAYERVSGRRLNLANAKASEKDAKAQLDGAMYRLERAIRGEFDLLFAEPLQTTEDE